jgi:hypothetical protein
MSERDKSDKLDRDDNARARRAREYALRRSQRLRRRDFEVAPKIFLFRASLAVPYGTRDSLRASLYRLAAGTVAGALSGVDAAVYNDLHSSTSFFGFRDLAPLESARRAALVLATCRNALGAAFDVRLSASTLGARRFRAELSAPWSFIGSERLREALTCSVRFNPLEDHLREVTRVQG